MACGTDPAGLEALSLAHREKTISPDFTALLLTGIALGAAVLWFMAWRFGGANMGVFVVVAGLFPAVMDFLSSFVARNYETGLR